MWQYRKQIKRIYSDIDQLAKGGKDNVFDYYLYVDRMVNEGTYGTFGDVLAEYYDMEISNIKTVSLVKTKSWPIILSKTYSYFQIGYSNLFNQNGVYQLGLGVYRSSDNFLLGQISQINTITDAVTYSTVLTYDLDQQFAKGIKIKKTDLIVDSFNPTGSTAVTVDNLDIDYDQNLLNKYNTAITYLLSTH